MTDQQWKDLLAVLRGERVDPPRCGGCSRKLRTIPG
jgi:hypothetical protein